MCIIWRKMIAHVDMDAFFAAVEQLVHPEWRGKPVIVGADPKGGKGRGVVSTASYEARKYGVHSAMPISQAYRLCPQGIFVRPNGKLYQHYSRLVFQVLNEFTPQIEPLSIDEAFLDITQSAYLFGGVKNTGEEIKRRIRERTGLTASVGISSVKSVAKIASDFDKPDGLVIVPPDEILHFLSPLPVSALWGVGKRMVEELEHLGIRTVGDVQRLPLQFLEERFGKLGVHVYNMALGKDEREVHPLEEPKSVSNETTFEQDEEDFERVRNVLFTLCEKVGGRLRRTGLRGRRVFLKIRFSNFRTNIRSRSLPDATNLTDEIFSLAEMLLEEFAPLPLPVRLIGVGVSRLVREEGRQLSLWDMDKERKLKLEKVMDQLQDKYGKQIILHARSLEARNTTREFPEE